MIEISNICLHQNSIFIKFLKILKIHEIFCENPRIIFVLFYDVHTENMFTINLEDGHEAPSKASSNKFKYNIYVLLYRWTNNILIVWFKHIKLKNIRHKFIISNPLTFATWCREILILLTINSAKWLKFEIWYGGRR